ncbi:MAG: hypothetical protein QF483_06130 [Gammaproteobacteria bacterium]|nr:hypothetical protein [Gammaproteobacteria bacterium]MDP7419440.1 hypothetical protein [Gammaproteobacteria bacterium]HJP39538.1 hypothetical protein [Gammaproteobacteria bacterium]
MKRWIWLVPLLLALVVYAPAPWGELVWDDPLVFDKQMVAFKSIGDAFFPPDDIFQWSKHYYRPVVILSYMLDISLYGNAQTAGLHISNVLYHLAVTFFVLLLARRLFRHLPNGWLGAVLAATIFAVHPIHTESVSWIAGRSDVLAALFFVPCIMLTLNWRDTGGKWALALAALCYMLALMAKEVAIAALVIVPAALALTPPRANMRIAADKFMPGQNPMVPPSFGFGFHANLRMWLATAAMLLGITGLYLVLRQVEGVAYGVPLEVPWLEYAARFEKSVAYYLVKVLVPWPQSNHAAWESAPGSIVTNGVFLVAVGLFVLSLMVWRRQRDGVLLLALLWFGAAVAPSIAVAVRHISGTPLAERYLYLPSVGLALLLGIVCCLPFLGNWVKPARWLVILLIGVYVAAGIERGMVWISNEKLWIDTTNKLPSHGEPWNLLGIEYLEQRKYAKALQAFQRAITAQNNATGRSYAKRNIAVIYQLQNDSQRAKEFYLSALEERDDNPEALHGLGVIYLDEARNIEQEGDGEDQVAAKLNRAVAYFAATLGLNSYHVEARWGLVTALANLGRRYELQRNPEQAVQHYQSALAEVTTLIAHDPALQSRQDIQNTRAGIRSALQRLAR